MKVTDIITLDQLRALRAAGLIVVHQEPTESMCKAGLSAAERVYGSLELAWHRMVAESIRLQQSENRSAEVTETPPAKG